MRSAHRSRMGIIAVAVTLVASVTVVAALGGSVALAASTFVVDTTTDSHDAVPGDGICADAAGLCSLRAAAEEANGNAGMDTITVPAGTYTYTIASRIVFSDNTTVAGAASAVTTIDADGLSGVFGVDGRATLPSLRITGLTITGGDGLGGGIYIGSGALNLLDSTVTGNTGPRGGGIFNDIGAVGILNSMVHDNTATADSGGGIVVDRGTMYVTNSTISDNVATASGSTSGGGVENNAVLVMTNSTVSGNRGGMGGGIYNANSGMLTLVHSTVAGNDASYPGGGIFNDGGSMTLTASILDGNTNRSARSDCFSTVPPTSGGYNFIGDGTGCMWVAGSGDIVGTATAPLSAGLGPLQDNGGPTTTHALLPGPPVAINTIPVAACAVATDQRGVVRPQGGMCDKGAFEVEVVVDTVGLVDPLTGAWRLRDGGGAVTSFFYGNPGDLPISGDWDGDGDATPGLYRQSDGFFYSRNSNTTGVADAECFAGDPADVPVAGDWDGDGDDNLGIYRPSTQMFYLYTSTCTGSPMGAAQIAFLFGNPGDKPVAGDWDGDGIDEVGLHRESTGFFYWRNTLTTGVADGEIFFGDPGDRFVSGDWGVVDGKDTPAVFRPSDQTFYFRHTLTQGVADSQFTWTGAGTDWLPVSGRFGLD